MNYSPYICFCLKLYITKLKNEERNRDSVRKTERERERETEKSGHSNDWETGSGFLL